KEVGQGQDPRRHLLGLQRPSGLTESGCTGTLALARRGEPTWWCPVNVCVLSSIGMARALAIPPLFCGLTTLPNRGRVTPSNPRRFQMLPGFPKNVTKEKVSRGRYRLTRDDGYVVEVKRGVGGWWFGN